MRITLALAVALFAFGCNHSGRGAEPAAPSSEPRPTEHDEPTSTTEDPATFETVADAECVRLTRYQCYLSRECTLVRDPSDETQYVCRPPRNHCEADYSQLSAYETSPASGPCEVRDGCRWMSQDGCYCSCRGHGQTAVPDGDEAPDCDCECAHGDPGGCIPT